MAVRCTVALLLREGGGVRMVLLKSSPFHQELLDTRPPCKLVRL
jgi:hypothetical protein